MRCIIKITPRETAVVHWTILARTALHQRVQLYEEQAAEFLQYLGYLAAFCAMHVQWPPAKFSASPNILVPEQIKNSLKSQISPLLELEAG